MVKLHLPMQEMQKTQFDPGLGRSAAVGSDNPLQYPYLENSMDRGAWWAAVHELTKS